MPPSKKLEDLIHLTELCVDLLQQNEEHYAEVRGKTKNNRLIISFTILKIILSYTQLFRGTEKVYFFVSNSFQDEKILTLEMIIVSLFRLYENRLKSIPLTQLLKK